MRRSAQILFGVLPAMITAFMALAILTLPRDIASGWLSLWLIPAAWLGVAGLIWATVGVKGNMRWVVIGLLAIGMVAMLWKLAPLLLSSVLWAVTSGGVPVVHQRTLLYLVQLIVRLWLIGGPLVIGTMQIHQLLRAGRPSNSSLERTGEG